MEERQRSRALAQRTLLSYLRRRFDVVVEHPDHPLLFSGPDILVGDAGRLFAYFLPTARESDAQTLLVDRLTASRLAFPDHTRCLLVALEDRSAVRLDVRKAFDAVVTARDPLTPEIEQSRHQLVDRGLRTELSIRQDYLYRLSVFFAHPRRRTDAGMHSVRTMVDDRGQSMESARALNLDRLRWARVAPIEGSLVVAPRQGASVSPGGMLQQLSRLTTRANFRMDNGIIYGVGFSTGVIAIPQLPRRPIDPMKPFRAAAFAGWAVVEDPSMDTLERVARRTAERFPLS